MHSSANQLLRVTLEGAKDEKNGNFGTEFGGDGEN